jgi:RNA recognition motif-containing protein
VNESGKPARTTADRSGNAGRVESQVSHGEVRLLVRGIARGVASTDIAELFRPYGGDPERIALPKDRRTRRRKGIAYVFVPSVHAARAAVEALNNTTFQEKQITVELAAERPPKKPRRFNGPPGGGPPRRF